MGIYGSSSCFLSDIGSQSSAEKEDGGGGLF